MRPIPCAAVLAALTVVAIPQHVSAQARPAPDPLADCERFAVAESKRDGGSLKAIRIERGDSLIENRFDKKIGGQHVATEYIAFAAIEDGSGKRRGARGLPACGHAGQPGGLLGRDPEIGRGLGRAPAGCQAAGSKSIATPLMQ